MPISRTMLKNLETIAAEHEMTVDKLILAMSHFAARSDNLPAVNKYLAPESRALLDSITSLYFPRTKRR